MELRQVLCESLKELMAKDDKIVVLDADLAKPNGTKPLYDIYPDRCFDCGIAESNMVSVAAGLSAYGYKPVISSFAPFITRRVFDQICVSVAYAKQSVKIIGTDPGILAETNGGTHITFEDVALMRTIPGMVIYDVVDERELKSALPVLMSYPGNVYIRMARKIYPIFHSESYEFKIGHADIMLPGNDITIIATGIMIKSAMEAANKLKEEGISAEVISLSTIFPLDKEGIIASIKKTKHIVTCENHSIHGGLYSDICELTSSELPIHVGCVAIQERFGQVGTFADLAKEYGLTAEDIYNECKKELSIKKEI